VTWFLEDYRPNWGLFLKSLVAWKTGKTAASDAGKDNTISRVRRLEPPFGLVGRKVSQPEFHGSAPENALLVS